MKSYCQPELVEGGLITKTGFDNTSASSVHPDTLLIAEFVICNLSRLFGKSLKYFYECLNLTAFIRIDFYTKKPSAKKVFH